MRGQETETKLIQIIRVRSRNQENKGLGFQGTEKSHKIGRYILANANNLNHHLDLLK